MTRTRRASSIPGTSLALPSATAPGTSSLLLPASEFGLTSFVSSGVGPLTYALGPRPLSPGRR